jgi:hypothetical protein
MRRMPAALSLILVLASSISFAVAQQVPQWGYPATVSRSGETVTIIANGPRPMRDAVQALSIEYGWTVDIEEPIYQIGPDTRDATGPAWREQHPNLPGLIGVRGGQFVVNFDEAITPGVGTQSEVEILKNFVAAYNDDNLPGNFTLKNEDPTHVSVVGTSRSVTGEAASFLDTPVTLPQQTVDAASAIVEILAGASKAAGVKSVLASGPIIYLSLTQVKIGGDSRPARDELRSVLDDTGRALCWSLLYDPNDGVYHLNIRQVVRKAIDSHGHEMLIPVPLRQSKADLY